MSQSGYFLIADITGYTAYLSSSELDHAQQTLTALLNLLIRHTNPPLIISRLAGDAVISYGLKDGFLQGQTFAEAIEDTYVDFRRAIERMVRNTSCTCNACRNIGALDLKFFVHFGQFNVQKLDAHDELVGAEVILIHRLLKNHVTERFGLKAYTLYTDAALTQLGLGEAKGALLRNEESYEEFEPVTTWVQDMHPVWERKRVPGQARIPASEELLHPQTEVALPPEIVWDYLVQPQHYVVLLGASRVEISGRADGRVQAGSTLQCYHGDKLVPLALLEWEPFERMVAEFTIPIPIAGVTGLSEIRLQPTERGTRLHQVFSKARGPLLGRLMANALFGAQAKSMQRDLERFRDHLEAQQAGRGFVQTPPIPQAEISAAARESLRPA